MTRVLLMNCPDRPGVVAAVSEFLYRRGANIVHADQYQDPGLRLFFMRLAWEGYEVDPDEFSVEFGPLAARYALRYRMARTQDPARIAIFVSRFDHCLVDLLHRWRIGELPCEVALVIGNHDEGEAVARFYGAPFHLVSISNRAERELEQMRLLELAGVDLIVLARYMQILSPDFVGRYPMRIINVHHSFLPAFSGAKPYHQALERAVKLIGATSHYVTAALDDGPIIEQDVTRVSHRDQLPDLINKGRDLEKSVLGRAVRWHLQHRILVYGRKTVIFA